MASAKEIKKRIETVRETRKITNAMYLISQTKMRKARAEFLAARPYFDMVTREIKRIFQSRSDVRSHYFYPESGRKEAERYAYLVITADKGLAGAYNMNVLRRMEEEMQRHKRIRLYVVGEFGRRYCKRHHIPIEQAFLYTAQHPSFRRARKICSLLLSAYDVREVDEIRVIYSDMKSEGEALVKVMQLLPFERKPFVLPAEEQSSKDRQYRFRPSVTQVLNQIMPFYIAGFIYGALVDSFSVEQNERMKAMKTSTDNADELLSKLNRSYNRLRQSAITQEISEIASGARALR